MDEEKDDLEMNDAEREAMEIVESFDGPKRKRGRRRTARQIEGDRQRQELCRARKKEAQEQQESDLRFEEYCQRYDTVTVWGMYAGCTDACPANECTHYAQTFEDELLMSRLWARAIRRENKKVEKRKAGRPSRGSKPSWALPGDFSDVRVGEETLRQFMQRIFGQLGKPVGNGLFDYPMFCHTTGMVDEVYEIGSVSPWECLLPERLNRVVTASDIVLLTGDPQPKEGIWLNDKFLEKGSPEYEEVIRRSEKLGEDIGRINTAAAIAELRENDPPETVYLISTKLVGES